MPNGDGSSGSGGAERRPAGARGWLRLVLAALLFGGLGVWTAGHLKVTSALTAFVTSPEEAAVGDLVARLAASEGARTMIMTVQGEDLAAGIAGADALAARLGDDAEVAWVRTGVDPAASEAFYRLVHPHRFGLAADRPEDDLPPRLSDPGLAAMAAELERRLSLPTAALVKRVAPGDPWLFFLDRVAALERMRGASLRVEDDHLVTPDGRAAVVMLATVHSPFDAAHQAPLHDAIEGAVAELADEGVVVERSAVARLAVQSEREIRADVQRIAIVSSIAVVVLLGALYRSLRVLLLATVPLGCGLVAGAAACAAAFPGVHGITVAFGATLIGVAIDYPLHLFTHHALAPAPDGAAGTLRRIAPGLRAGAATTVVAFATLALAGMPGVREIGVFAGVGIAVAATTTMLLLPPLLPDVLPPPPTLRALARATAAALRAARAHPRALALLPAAALGIAVVGIPRVRWLDDSAALTRLEPTALAEDEHVRARVGRVDLGRLVVATGATVEQALERNDAVARRLEAAAAEDRVAFASLHDLVWSEDLQARNLEVFAAAPDLAGRARGALQAAGFRPEAFAELDEDLARPPPPLSLEAILDSPLGAIARPFLLLEGQPPAVLTFVRDLASPDALTDDLADLPGVVDFDRRRFSADLYRRHRERVTRWTGVGLVLVLGLLVVLFRRPGLVVAAVAPAVLSVATVIAMLGLLGEPLLVLHLMGLLLVLGIGVDYGVFLAARARGGAELGPTLAALVAACGTTVGAFGLLAWSSHPALRALGITVGPGVALSLVLAPTTLVLLGERGRR